MAMPTSADIASFGFGTPAIENYLQSPNFQANTTYGQLMGINPSMQQGGMSNLFGSGQGGLFSMDGLKLIGGGLSTIGNLWNAFQAQKLAKDQFKFTKEFSEKNLANQIQSYNTALEDRINSRAFTEGRDQTYVNDYIAKNKL